MTTAGLVCLLILGLVAPVAGQEPVTRTTASGGGRISFAGDLATVDWSRYLPTDRSFAAAGGADPATEAEVRAALRGEEPVIAAGSRTFADRTGQRNGRSYDTCNDAGGSRLDLRATMLAARNDQQGFLGYTCRPWATPDLADSAFIWSLYTEEYGPEEPEPALDEDGEPIPVPEPEGPPEPRYPDFHVAVFLHRGVLETVVVRAPSEDPATWYPTWHAPGQRVDEHAVDTVVPTKAFGQAPGSSAAFHFEWSVTSGARFVDQMPEYYEGASDIEDYDDLVADLPSFPHPCGPYVGQAADSPGGPVAANGAGADWTLAGVGTDRSHTSSNRIVAIVDDGVSGQRAGLAGRVLSAYDGHRGTALRDVANLRGSLDSDRGGHGSAVASVLAGSRAAGAGISGLDIGAHILPISVVDANGCIEADDLARGITYAAKVLAGETFHPEVEAIHQPFVNRGERLPGHVMVIPVAGPDTPEVRKAIDGAQARGVLVVAAAGNDGGSVGYPAAYPGVVAVGASTADRRPAAYSATGRALDVLAPGGDGSGRTDRDVVAFWDLDQLRSQHGTGLSAGLVGAAASLYRSTHPSAGIGDVRRALEASARDMVPEGHDPTHGYGRLDLTRLLAATPEPDLDRGLLDRVDAGEPAHAATVVSQRRYPTHASAPHVVLARHDLFADALAGAPLTATGPLLLSGRTVLPARTDTELSRVLRPGGTVYLLGGTSAIDAGVAAELERRGFVVRRLSGPSRIETSIAIADEVRRLHGSTVVGMARAYGTSGDETAAWADAITGGAWAARSRTPLVVTTSDRVHPAVADALRRWAPAQTVLLGGVGALSPTVEATVPNPRRVSGPERAATAVAIADLWDGQRTGFTVVNGYTPSGWAFGMAGAGLAADTGRPLLVATRDTLPEVTAQAIRTRCQSGQDVLLIGDFNLIGGNVEERLAGEATC